MAYVATYDAGVRSGDVTGQKRAASIKVTEAKAKLWFAAADHAARMATDVGLLLQALNDAQSSDGTTAIYSYYVSMEDINDAYAKPDIADAIFNTNKIKLTYATTKGGIPVSESIYIPQRLSTLTLSSDGKSYDLTVSPFPNIATQLIATGRSSYGTAITGLIEAIPNDS